MTKILNSGLALILLAVGSISASADILYINDLNGNFGTVNTVTDQVTYLGKSGIALSDIGFTANGDLFGSTHTALYQVNPLTGATTLYESFGGAGGSNIVGLVGDGSSLLANSYATTKLYAIDVSPNSVSSLSGSTGFPGQGDLAFGSNGALYDTLNNGDLARITISGTSITSSIVGFTHVAGSTTPIDISGLAEGSNGAMYALAGTEVYLVDLNTAVLTPFLNYSGHGIGADSGAAIFTAVVPEPSSVALLLAGVVGLVYYQRRRTATQA